MGFLLRVGECPDERCLKPGGGREEPAGTGGKKKTFALPLKSGLEATLLVIRSKRTSY